MFLTKEGEKKREKKGAAETKAPEKTKQVKISRKEKKQQVAPLSFSFSFSFRFKQNVNGKVEINNYADLYDFLHSQNLIEFMGLDVKENEGFCCLYHNDTRPSATIAQKNDVWRYFCNSDNCEVNKRGLDIVDIFRMKEKKWTFSHVIKYLCKEFNIEFISSPWAQSQMNKYQANMNFVLNDLTKEKYPSLYKLISPIRLIFLLRSLLNKIDFKTLPAKIRSNVYKHTSET